MTFLVNWNKAYNVLLFVISYQTIIFELEKLDSRKIVDLHQ